MNPGKIVTVLPGANENEGPPETVNVSREIRQMHPRPKMEMEF